jgi:hypothetical protein
MRSYSTGDLRSVSADIPQSHSMTDVSECINTLRKGYSAKENFICRQLLREGGYWQYAQQNYTNAYALYKQATFGTGITKYSRALGKYFDGCVRTFFESPNIDQDLIMVKFRRRAKFIEKHFLCLCGHFFEDTLSKFALEEQDPNKAIEFQKMALFYMIFEDEVFDHSSEPSLYERIQEKMEVLCRLEQQKPQ